MVQAILRPVKCVAAPRSSDPQMLRVMAQMIRHEGLDEVVAVIVARLQAQVQRLARPGGGGGELIRQQLFGEKWIARALVDENVPGKLPARDEFAGVVFAPCLG